MTAGRPDVTASVEMTARRFGLSLGAILLLAALLRTLFPVADPPWFSTVGVVWHDEGAWVHNARNRALTGEWQVPGDRWNPLYITPVLTGLEYLSFSAFGVGLWQARLVSEVMGVLAVLLLGLGVARVGGRRAGVAAAALLATNFVAVMYDRAALMEATMVSLAVTSWYCYARSDESPRWGLAAGAAAVAAYFTKASAVFLLPALATDALLTIALARGWLGSRPLPGGSDGRRTAGAWYTLAGLTAAGLASLAMFVVPNWESYRFYNWQMSVVRKPSYTLKSLADRITWFPVIHNFFSRMWVVTAVAVSGGLGLLLRWREIAPAERVLGWWVVIGVVELVLHDVGNERRFVFLIPPVVALASLAIGRERCLLDERAGGAPLRRAVLAAPVVLACLYLLAGSAVRVPFLDDVHTNVFRSTVRWSAGAALLLTAAVYAGWPWVPRLLTAVRWSAPVGVVIVLALMASDLRQYAEWAARRTCKNHRAMREVGRWLPEGTVVHGKLANGLSLESRITPVFVGRGFGNYEDRATRTDARYLLTYSWPRRTGERFGYESQRGLISEILAASPGWIVVREFDVAETAGNHDRAVLIDKYPHRAGGIVAAPGGLQ
jgi:4-amino-4-deoxy-L-arabinose transferase-like glycosyltransferase